jgi:hypothetical protein
MSLPALFRLPHRARRRTASRLIGCGLTLSLLGIDLSMPVPAGADQVYWQGGASGAWYTAANWNSHLPTSLDDVFNTAGYDSIAIDNGSSQSAGTLTNNGVIDVSSGSLNVAQDVFNLTTFGSPATIQARGAGSAITLNGAGGSLTNGGVIQAYEGATLTFNTAGTLTNKAGAIIATDYSDTAYGGTLVFNGAGSLDNAGMIGSTTIGSGGYVTGSLTGAFTNESTGTLTLDSGSNLTLGNTGVASSNAGTITVTNGSILNLNATTFTNSSIIDGSNGGNISVNVATNLMNTAPAVIATDYTGPANGSTLAFSGAGSLDNAGMIGSTTIGSGGSVTGSLTGAFTNESTGTLTLDSGSNLALGNTGVASSNAGTITVTNSNLTNNSFLTLNASVFTNSALIDASNEGQITFNINTKLANLAGAVIATDATSNTNGGVLAFSGAGSLDNAGTIGSTTIGSGGSVTGSLTGAFTNESTGTLTLDSGSNLTLGNTGVASSNAGTITVTNSSQLMLIASTFTNTGTLAVTEQGAITLNGATVLAGGSFNVGANSTATASKTLTQTGGTTQVDGTLTTTTALLLKGGDLVGSGTINGDVNNSGGTVQPGDGLGTLAINGKYTQTTGGKTEILLGGLQQGVTYDLLSVTNLATLGGELDVKLTNGFMASNGQTFDFLSYGSRTGVYSSLVVLDPGYGYSVSYDDADHLAILTVTAGVPEGSTLFSAALMLVTGGLLLRRRRRQQPVG